MISRSVLCAIWLWEMKKWLTARWNMECLAPCERCWNWCKELQENQGTRTSSEIDLKTIYCEAWNHEHVGFKCCGLHRPAWNGREISYNRKGDYIDNNALNRRNDKKLNSDVVLETSENTDLVVGQKKAWMFFGRLKSDTIFSITTIITTLLLLFV